MFLGSIIYNKRREMNLTQIELANDICTQNTISKIEKHNIAPTVNILIKICLKLDLTLNDVFSDFSERSSIREESILDEIERNVLLKELDGMEDKINSLKGKLNNNDMKQYELIIGVMDYWNKKLDTALFNLDKVLQYTKSDDKDVYTLLAYLFKGLSYLGQNHTDRAQYYFQMIDDSINDGENISNANNLEIIFICKTLAESFNKMKLYKRSYDFSQYGLNFVKENRILYFLDELNYSAAVAIKKDSDKKQEYKDYYNLAFYLAKATNNAGLLKTMNEK